MICKQVETTMQCEITSNVWVTLKGRADRCTLSYRTDDATKSIENPSELVLDAGDTQKLEDLFTRWNREVVDNKTV